ncbi:MAG TPA: cupin domain-containing protein [Nocardioidaceae bacterium]|nr:cupin domain-containing protein [Nocardioidaceae bacterium]
MSSANRMTTPVGVDEAQIEGRYARLEDYTVSFETYKEDLDPAPFFAGLPDDRCQCPHWGIVTAGQVTFRWADHDETYVEGDAYYAPPAHVPLVVAGTTVVEFSPTAELDRTMAVVGTNLEAAKASS